MRIGLVGRGPQAKRYLDPRNGGNMVTSQVPGRVKPDDYIEWLGTVDAVVIATHPSGHEDLSLIAISCGKPLLVEKPLALTWDACERIIAQAEPEWGALWAAKADEWKNDHPLI